MSFRRFLAAQRVLNAFSHKMGPLPRLSFWGLAHWTVRRSGQTPLSLTVPWGWRAWKEADLNRRHIMPAWLYYPLMAWRYRWWALYPLLRCGLLELDEGARWREARPSCPDWLRSFLWCFLHDRDRAPDWAARRAQERRDRADRFRAQVAQFRATLAADGREFGRRARTQP